MPLKFKKTQRQAAFLDPFRQFQPTERTVEIRRDPLTGDQSRILPFRRRVLAPLDHQAFLSMDPPDKCPFCPGNLDRAAARFLPEQAPQGRLSLGQAVCFPNAFPYEAMNTVLVLSQAHYLAPSQFTPELLGDALWLSREAFGRLAPGLSYGSVNWNYLMPAGAGLVHPHFQLAAGREPSRAQAAMRSRARAHARRHPGADIAADYLAAERAAGQRYIGRSGPCHWLAAFAPRSLFDIMGLVPGGRGLGDLSRRQVHGLALGICRVLNYLERQGVGSFNLAMHTGLRPGAGLPLMVRLVSRVHIPPKGVDEINYFHKLHDETLTFIPPEEVAQELRRDWRGLYIENT